MLQGFEVEALTTCSRAGKTEAPDGVAWHELRRQPTDAVRGGEGQPDAMRSGQGNMAPS